MGCLDFICAQKSAIKNEKKLTTTHIKYQVSVVFNFFFDLRWICCFRKYFVFFNILSNGLIRCNRISRC